MRYERKNFQFLKNAHIGLEAAFLRSFNHQARAFHNRVNDNQNLIAGCAFVMRHRRFGDFEKFRFSPQSQFHRARRRKLQNRFTKRRRHVERDDKQQIVHNQESLKDAK